MKTRLKQSDFSNKLNRLSRLGEEELMGGGHVERVQELKKKNHKKKPTHKQNWRKHRKTAKSAIRYVPNPDPRFSVSRTRVST